MKARYIIFFLFFTLLDYSKSNAAWKTAIQWQKTIGGSNEDLATTSFQTQDGGYIIGGSSSSGISGNKTTASKGGTDYWIIKLDALSNIEWQKTIGGNANEDLRSIQQLADGSYILGGYSESSISGDKTSLSNGGQDFWLIKLDITGNILWQKSFGGSGDDAIFDLKPTSDGGYILGGTSNSDVSGDKTEASFGNTDIWVIKTDANGNILWQKTIGGSDMDRLTSITETNDSGYFISGNSSSDISGNKTEANQGGIDFLTVKLNNTGSIVWQNTIGGSADDNLVSAQQTFDGGFILGGNSYSPVSGDKTQASFNGDADLWLIKLDFSGNIMWQKNIGGNLWDQIYSLKQTRDGGFILGANSASSASVDKTEESFGITDYWVVKVDTIGNIQWQNTIGGNNDDLLLSIQQTFDGSYFFAGYSSSDISGKKTENSKGGNDFWIVKLITDPRYISGNIFIDNNTNCIKNNGEKNLPQYSLKAVKNSNQSNAFFTTTDSIGNYDLAVNDTGKYTISLLPNSSYPFYTNSVCNVYDVNLVDSFTTLNLSKKAFLQCSLNTVNVSTSSLFRIGRPSTYYVNYCNNGTVLSQNTYIDIELDSMLQFNNSSIPSIFISGNTYRFNVGNLDYLSCGDFSFVASPIVNQVQLGQTLCVEAHIYPDTICTNPTYNAAFIEATAVCLGDSVQFKLKNTGKGNMSGTKKFKVIEGNVMIVDQNFQLNTNQVFALKVKTTSGSTYRIIAEQPDGLPTIYGDAFVTAALENCQPITNFPTGFFLQFPTYDGEPYRSLSCTQIIGSYDPNDKVATPVGYSAQHFIEANTQIDYQINFQNTGNDTAFKIVVIDTISSKLDINSIQLGTSSHNFEFERIDTNVVQFVFNNIMLVDSFKNEKLSHGFVKFKIQQKANNVDGTKIYNKADIYFDYNAPIKTNQTYHKIGRDFIEIKLLNEIKNTKYNVKEVKIFPNPFRDKTQIIVESDALKNPVLLLLNVEGQILKTIPSTYQNTFDLYRGDLTNGLYIFKILEDNQIISTGKLIAQ
ncbi:MAG: T9SS type A sorting domain-containing protein [Chitinophagales bacterium]|nr:T9SS type A sorting domain-containing protein [Chitinophagales bacterium]